MKRFFTLIFVLVLLLTGCGAQSEEPSVSEQGTPTPTEVSLAEPENLAETEPQNENREESEPAMKLKINDTAVEVAWEDNETVDALRELVQSEPLTISMSMYGGFEQVGPIGSSLPRNDVQTTTAAGDIVLYSGNQIVVFYGSNSWAYTRLGKIQGLSDDELAELLGDGAVTLTLF